MSQVTQSAARSATQLSNGIQSIGNAFEVANVHSSAWLEDTKLKVRLSAVHRRKSAIREVADSISSATIEQEKKLASNPALRIAFDAAVAELEAALAA
jgi:hypothetical protein